MIQLHAEFLNRLLLPQDLEDMIFLASVTADVLSTVNLIQFSEIICLCSLLSGTFWEAFFWFAFIFLVQDLVSFSLFWRCMLFSKSGKLLAIVSLSFHSAILTGHIIHILFSSPNLLFLYFPALSLCNIPRITNSLQLFLMFYLFSSSAFGNYIFLLLEIFSAL